MSAHAEILARIGELARAYARACDVQQDVDEVARGAIAATAILAAAGGARLELLLLLSLLDGRRASVRRPALRSVR